MILIADGGSTKTHWALITKDFNTKEFYSEGYNPYFVNKGYIVDSLQKALPADLLTETVEKIFFYGAGVHNKEKGTVLCEAFTSIFKNATCEAESDLIASCKALLGDDKGFAAILGTGTNTCIYDGNKVAYQINSAAYILGDEGSGCHMGKKLITDFIRDRLPVELDEKFKEKYGMTKNEILDRVYTQRLVSRFCASFTQFLGENIEHSYCKNLVQGSFVDFFAQLVSQYPEYTDYSFNSVGSVGFYFQELLKESANKFGMQTGKVIKSPMPDLIKYHKKNMLKESILF